MAFFSTALSPQRISVRAAEVTLVAFVWFFSTVHLQMLPQMVWSRRCKVTLVAFVGLFSTVRSFMSLQLGSCIVTLVAFVWLFYIVCFQMCSFFLFLLCYIYLFSMLVIFGTSPHFWIIFLEFIILVYFETPTHFFLSDWHYKSQLPYVEVEKPN